MRGFWKFIQLDNGNRTGVLINPDHIVAVIPKENPSSPLRSEQTSSLLLTSGHTIEVAETRDEIAQLDAEDYNRAHPKDF